MQVRSLVRQALALVTFSVLTTSCGALPMGSGQGGGSRGSSNASCGGSYGSTQAAKSLVAFSSAVNDFAGAASDIDAELASTCREMGGALGIPSGDLNGPTESVCNVVATKLREERNAVKRAPGVRIDVQSVPPRCEVSVDAYGQCAAECDLNYTPGRNDMRCEGGEIVGRCDAQCTGSCAVDVSGTCGGTCEGTCSGQCSATAADGSCAGRCNGECRGRCEMSAQASCSGECRGGCSVDYREPRCTGTVTPPSIDPSCRAACDARLSARAQCTPGQTTVNISGDLGALSDRAANVRRAIEIGASKIALLKLRLDRLKDTGREVARTANGMPSAVRTLGASALACATGTAASLAGAVSSVNVSVSVTVSVSGSIKG